VPLPGIDPPPCLCPTAARANDLRGQVRPDLTETDSLAAMFEGPFAEWLKAKLVRKAFVDAQWGGPPHSEPPPIVAGVGLLSIRIKASGSLQFSCA
jgi:hypothetical protein